MLKAGRANQAFVGFLLIVASLLQWIWGHKLNEIPVETHPRDAHNSMQHGEHGVPSASSPLSHSTAHL